MRPVSLLPSMVVVYSKKVLEPYSDEILPPSDIAKEFVIFRLSSNKFQTEHMLSPRGSAPTDLGSQLISAPVGPSSGKFWQEKDRRRVGAWTSRKFPCEST